MPKEIDLNQTLYDLCTQYPEVTSIMVQLGFENIAKPSMLQTAGRVMTIPKGCRMKEIPLETVIATFQEHGFKIIE
ncbi:DUF1858 domain-containing protein [Bacillus sp. HMF5848]|uniref:DUF1858 domain-containing protein n=1 Tax=Bacillus sp. HMF5848 TaxID=2495421 RepID=UPI000F7938C6|nr:DUF1858 domain-containing protein [Bacillus sp. HMF5848]RSK25698.1 DUF1858 domain-containing protein [Bacillus sp. HMF5848]